LINLFFHSPSLRRSPVNQTPKPPTEVKIGLHMAMEGVYQRAALHYPLYIRIFNNLYHFM